MAIATPAMARVARSTEYVKLVAGFAMIYLVLDRSATWTNSLFGEYGALICVLVIAAALLVERLLFGIASRQALGALSAASPDALAGRPCGAGGPAARRTFRSTWARSHRARR